MQSQPGLGPLLHMQGHAEVLPQCYIYRYKIICMALQVNVESDEAVQQLRCEKQDLPAVNAQPPKPQLPALGHP